MASGQWRRLPLDAIGDVPDLCYDFSVKEAGFRLLVTDLIHIYKCSLGKEEVIKQAREQHCSIDPSESTSQLKTLILKLEDSLKSGNIVLICSGTGTEGSFVVQTTTKLPAPLQPLRWDFVLERQHAVELAKSITLPSLYEASEAASKRDSLFQVIKEKDHVITKLLDKIEGSAVDLSLIFPSTTGLKPRRSHVSVAEAAKCVPGLASFDKDAWISASATERGSSSHLTLTLSKSLDRVNIEDSLGRALEDWTSHLPSNAVLPYGNAKYRLQTRKKTPESNASRNEDPNGSGEEDFERTPLSKMPDLQQNAAIDNDNSSTELDTDEPAAAVFLKVKQSRIGTTGSRLGTLKRVSSPVSPKKTVKCPPHRRSDTSPASHASSSSETDSPKAVPKSKPKPTSKLGKLGGRKKTTPRKSSSPPPRHNLSNASTPSRRIGIVAGSPTKPKQTETVNRDEDSDATASDSSTPSPPAQSAPESPKEDVSSSPAPDSNREPPPNTETEQEAIYRRREELKRTVNSGGPAKKKRKF